MAESTPEPMTERQIDSFLRKTLGSVVTRDQIQYVIQQWIADRLVAQASTQDQ